VRRHCCRIIVAIAFAALGGASAAGERHPIDGEASRAGFTVRLIAVVPLDGEFGAIRGWIDVDRTTGTGRVYAVLAADSLRMRNPDHAAWARSAEFFDAARHPEIRFDSEPVPLTALASGGRLRGRLSVRGIERTVALSLEPGSCRPDHMLACEVGVRGRIRRSDFGMDARRATVGDWVALDIAIRTAAAAAADPDAGTATVDDTLPAPHAPR
jgi:polyisoprenoid-binding protein YceI